MKMTRWCGIFAVLFLSATVGMGCKVKAPPAPIGEVKEVLSGGLEVFGQKGWDRVSARDKVFAGDRIRTDKTGFAVLTLDNIGRFVVGPKTEFTLGEDPKDFKASLDKGSVWIKSLLLKGSRMSVATSLAVCGVRGTKFSILHDEQGMEVCTCAGDVDVVLKSGKVVKVPGGKYSSVLKDGRADAPESGLPILQKLRKGKAAERYVLCLDCHRGKKARDFFGI